jgi:hypothetical protein
MARNPFPGMNPFLERSWGDAHASLVLYARNQLNRQMEGPLRARVEERLVVESLPGDESRSIYPDVKVYQGTGIAGEQPVTISAAATLEPDIIQLAESEPETTTYLKIIDPSNGGTLVTVIEFLSPSNKRPRPARSAEQYHGKREELKLAGVSLLEIDLIRGGERFFPEYSDRYSKCLHTDYATCARRAWRPGEYEIYSFNLRDRLPVVRVPLRQQDPNAALDLQHLVDLVYEDGKYDDIDYTAPLDPPLKKSDLEWMREVLKT